MALSDYEKQVLEQMESELRRADPKLASKMSSEPDKSAPRGRLRTRNIVIGVLIALAGLVVIVFGVSLGYGVWAIVTGAAGFLVTVAGILFALRTDPSLPPREKKAKADGSSGAPWKSFLTDQQKRWDERKDD